MKMWPVYVLMTILCWGAYVPTIHEGQSAIGGRSKGLWAFLFVGLAYFLTAVLAPLAMLAQRGDLSPFPSTRGWSVSLFAGVLGALGALGVMLALMSGGTPKTVPPLVFAGAPVVSTIIAMALHPPASAPNPLFYVGILLAAAGAGIVLYYKPT
jgi:hypothetical protein